MINGNFTAENVKTVEKIEGEGRRTRTIRFPPFIAFAKRLFVWQLKAI